MDGSFQPGSVSLQLYADSGERKRPVTELYGVFRRPRSDADLSAGEVAARVGAVDLGVEMAERPPPSGVSAETWREARPGAVVHEEGRLLLAGLGGDEDMLYAAPTRNDHVAYAVLPNGGGGCAAPGPDGLITGWTQTELGDLVVYGLVSDAIEAVGFAIHDETHGVRMGENAFGLRLERTRGADLERIVLHRREGTTTEVALK